jgi:cytidylate kinase
VVAEGRDTTTVVFPDADVKVFMQASTRQRAQRRLLDLAKQGVNTSVDEQEADIIRRDEYDSGRKHSPLTRSREAYVIDTTNVTIEEQVERVLELILSTLK